ncbi:MAG: hypothetical protein RLY20_443 [Verrucomicrobiota bacterium]
MALLTVFCGVTSSASSASPWFNRTWQADDGLPGDNVTGVAQTKNGYLWIATQTGLARFDGIRFLNLKIPRGRAHPIIRAMLLDDHDQLWLAEEGGVVATMLGQDRLFNPSVDGLSKTQPLGMVQDADGGIWISSLDGTVCRIADGKVRRFSEADGLPAGGTCCLVRDVHKQVWFAKAGQVGVFREGRFQSLFSSSERSIQMIGSADGGLWICAGDSLRRSVAGQSPVGVATILGDTTPTRPTVLFEDSKRALWIGTMAGGLFRYNGTNVVRVETSHRRIRSITEDREGNIWVGTDGGGLNRLREQVVEIQGIEAGMPFDTVRSVCEASDGIFWVVTQTGEVVNNEAGTWQPVADWIGGQATCVTCDKAGVIWIGTYSRGVQRWQDGKFTALRRTSGLAQAGVRSLFADRRGDLWIAFSTGDVLQRYRDGAFKNYDLPAESRPIRAFAEDEKGTLWMANLDMRLLRVDGDAVIDETDRTTEPHHPIRCLAATPDGSLWIGYSSSGLGLLKNGRFTKVGLDEGLRDDSICSMTADCNGNMWFGSDHGIFRATIKEFLDLEATQSGVVKCYGYGRDEGLPSLQGYYGYAPGACTTKDGRVLIPTHSGLAIVHADRIRNNNVRPPVIIERVEADGQGIDFLSGSRRRAQLQPDHRKVEFFFNAPSFIESEKVRFRYQLEGWDEEWVESDGERTVAYSRLPDGEYCFRVTAGNSDGLWNETGAEVRFVVTAFIWNTWWFRFVSVVGLVGLTYAVVRFVAVRRLRAKVARLERENALQKERARIAQDIHDDLGARMTQISLLTELTQQSIARPQAAADNVAQIASLSQQGIKSLDEIVWAVNPRNDTLADLLDYAGQYAVDFLRIAGVRCRVDFPTAPPKRELSGEIRHGLFLAVKESLNNVVKHAHATEVSVRAVMDDQNLILEIADNGRGFVTPPPNALADGLRNLQTRISDIGGKCDISSRLGAGTVIRFEIPWALQQRGI